MTFEEESDFGFSLGWGAEASISFSHLLNRSLRCRSSSQKPLDFISSRVGTIARHSTEVRATFVASEGLDFFA